MSSVEQVEKPLSDQAKRFRRGRQSGGAIVEALLDLR
jgi:hypothetical protein